MSSITETNRFLANYYTRQVLIKAQAISLTMNLLQTEDLKLPGSANRLKSTRYMQKSKKSFFSLQSRQVLNFESTAGGF